MSSAFMERFAQAAAENGIAVARFNFPYMVTRETTGKKMPPPKAEKLVGAFQTALQGAMSEADGPILIGGKSMGGRVAAMLGGGQSLPARVLGIACLGYPFHASGKRENWRLEPLETVRRPVLIAQGDRDTFGSKTEIDELSLPETVNIHYLADGNHDFAPPGRSPATWDGNIHEAAKAVAEFAASLIKA